jgi:hypothetical protein
MSFYLVRLEPDGNGGMRDVPLPDHDPYEKGSDAAKAAKQLTDQLGYKVQPRRMAQAPDWRGRQQERLASGQLKALPEAWDLQPITDHFAHLSARDPSKIAYTESEELGTIDRVTITTPGRYLTKFYPEVDDDHRRRLIAAVDPAGEIHYVFKPEEISEIYKTGPSSCMDGKHNFSAMDPYWPTDPYGAGDLAVAYTKNAEGRIQSRVLCWPEKKLFGRCYGDIQRMQAAMKAEGYADAYNDGKFPSGAKILKIEHPEKPGFYVMPYFDNIDCVILKGDYFETYDGPLKDTVGHKYIICGSSVGHSDLYQWCPKMRAGRPAKEFRLVRGIEQEWCKDAIDGYAFTCRATKQIWSNEYRVLMGAGYYWCKEHFETHGEHCTFTGKNHPKDEMVQKGERRVHKSVEWRFDEQGNPLSPVQIRMIEQDQIMRLRLEGDHANGPSIRDMLRKELMAADREGRNPWLRTMQYRDYPNDHDHRVFFSVDPAAPGADAAHVANLGVSGLTARQVIVDDIQTAQLDPRQHEQMQRWMNDMVEDQLMGRTDRPRRYAQSNNR